MNLKKRKNNKSLFKFQFEQTLIENNGFRQFTTRYA